MSSSKVAVLKTSPERVLEDYGRLMRLADYRKHLPPNKDTALKINISWHHFYPACSTTPSFLKLFFGCAAGRRKQSGVLGEGPWEGGLDSGGILRWSLRLLGERIRTRWLRWPRGASQCQP